MKYLHTNNTDHYQYPQGRALPPGESVELDTDQCPEFAPREKKQKPAAKKSSGDDDAADLALKAFLDKPAKDVLEELSKATRENVSDTELKRLEELEQARKDPRKSVLGAIAEALLKRASETEGA